MAGDLYPSRGVTSLLGPTQFHPLSDIDHLLNITPAHSGRLSTTGPILVVDYIYDRSDYIIIYDLCLPVSTQAGSYLDEKDGIFPEISFG